MKKFNVLIFPCGTEIANEIIESLKYSKYFNLIFATSDKNSFCFYRNKEINFLPFVNSKNFENSLVQLISDKNLDFIFPAHDEVLYILSMMEDKLDTEIIGQEKEVNKILRFKDKTYDFFKKILPIPKYNITPKAGKDFPVFVKPVKGQGSQNAFKINSLKEYATFLKQKDKNKFVVMEYLPGEEYTIDCFSHENKILYVGPRKREKTLKGISIKSSYWTQNFDEFKKYAKIISDKLDISGPWFFQMKRDCYNNLKLLEIGPRISGTMMLNRARGVNFAELALYQKLGHEIEIIYNDINVSLARSLVPKYKLDVDFDNLYVDFDDTLLIEERYINADLMKLIFQCKNLNKNVYLITKHSDGKLFTILKKFGLNEIFDDIIELKEEEEKKSFIKKNSLFIDDSFAERKKVIADSIYTYDTNSIDVLLR